MFLVQLWGMSNLAVTMMQWSLTGGLEGDWECATGSSGADPGVEFGN